MAAPGGRSRAQRVRPFTFVAILSLFATLLESGLAGAFERQWHLGGGLGVASFASGEANLGPALGVHAAYGLSDMFDVRGELTGSTHTLDDERRVNLYSASLGIAYKIDVLEWVPYAGLFVGSYIWGGEAAPENQTGFVGISTMLGIDYALSRSFGLGLQLRYHGGLYDPPKSLTDGAYFTGLLRAEYRWGW